jgi:uncharacterized LabA/DUF88 family protein
MFKTALLIDGGHLRVCTKRAGKVYDNAFIEAFSHACFVGDEYLFRIFYYDSPQYRGKVNLPVSGNETTFQSNDRWLNDLAKVERFAVRRGTLGFRGWRPKHTPIAGAALTDADFTPIFEQKGVDMRIGLDIATFAERQSLERILLVSADTDMIPAMKQARKSGIEVGLIQLAHPALELHPTLKAHSDFVRHVALP